MLQRVGARVWWCAAKELAQRLAGVSPLGEYQRPLQQLLALTAIRPLARTYVKLPAWLPPVRDGRSFQVRAAPQPSPTCLKDARLQAGRPRKQRELRWMQVMALKVLALSSVTCTSQALSLLGPAFALGVVPDMVPPLPQPSVQAQCLQGLSKLGQGEALKTQGMLRAIMRTIHEQLHTLAMHFLGSKARAAPLLLVHPRKSLCAFGRAEEQCPDLLLAQRTAASGLR